MIDIASPLRLRLDSAALVDNWRWLGTAGGVEAGAAIKADGYGLGARAVMRHLAAAGCRHFFVATWGEAAALLPLTAGVSLRSEGRRAGEECVDTGRIPGLA